MESQSAECSASRFLVGLRDLGFTQIFKNPFMKALVAEWIHFILFGIMLPTIKLEAYTFWGL